MNLIAVLFWSAAFLAALAALADALRASGPHPPRVVRSGPTRPVTPTHHLTRSSS